MYFEGNSATWEHQDTYYLDAEKLGGMSAAWVALEDISAKAGRFFICPGSHKNRDRKAKQGNEYCRQSFAAYIEKIVGIMKEQNMEIRAPLLEAGDVLFWHARTMHGSLKSEDAYVAFVNYNARYSLIPKIPSDCKLGYLKFQQMM